MHTHICQLFQAALSAQFGLAHHSPICLQVHRAAVASSPFLTPSHNYYIELPVSLLLLGLKASSSYTILQCSTTSL